MGLSKEIINQDFYADLVEHASDLVQCVDAQGKFVYVNRIWREKLGYSDADLSTLNLWDIIHPDSLVHCQQTFQHVITGSQSGRVEAIFISKDGNPLSVEGAVNCRFDANGHVISTRGIFRDVSAQKENAQEVQAYHHLLEEQILLQDLLTQVTASFSEASPDDFDEKVDHALRLFGEYVSADRVYVFQYFFGLGICRNVFEWCQEGISPEIDNLENVPLEMMTEWVDAHTDGRPIHIPDVFALDPEDGVRILLEPQGVKSLLTLPMMNGDVCEGFIGFDSVRDHHRYTLNEERTLWQLSTVLRGAISRINLAKTLRESEERFRTTLLSVGDGVISTDSSGRIVVMNAVAEKLTGWKQRQAVGRQLEEIFVPINEYSKKKLANPAERVLKTGEKIITQEDTLILTKTGSEIPVEYSAAPILNKDGKITGAVLVFWDITEKREKQRQIEFLSFRDHLTGLYNRRYIEDALNRLDTTRNLPFSVIIMDVNGLKLTNDAFGHKMGDQLLKTVAEIISKSVRADDIIGRIGGDEFALLLPKTNELEAEAIKNRILEKTSQTKLDSVIVSLAAGVAVKEAKDQDINGVIQLADNNMYRNKLIHGKVMRSQTIEILIRSIHNKYDQEQIHTERVSQYSEAIAKALNLSDDEVKAIKTAALLHDIGKITVPPEILNKQGALTKEEIHVIHQHPRSGYQLLRNVDEFAPYADYALYHHERWDGKGYPHGLQGLEIPLGARIISVADAFEAMTAKRPYQKTRSSQEALVELEKHAGSQFDRDIVEVFVDIMR